MKQLALLCDLLAVTASPHSWHNPQEGPLLQTQATVSTTPNAPTDRRSY